MVADRFYRLDFRPVLICNEAKFSAGMLQSGIQMFVIITSERLYETDNFGFAA
jgi:hypothetical protein